MNPTVAVALITAWTALQAALMSWRPTWEEAPLVVVAVLASAWLFTGLFITAHDAMHGVAAPGQPRLNRVLGAVGVWLFAGFRYEPLRAAHRRHHAAPATLKDPDWHGGLGEGPAAWAWSFFRTYFGWRELLGISGAMGFLAAAGVPLLNLLMFWSFPSILSAAQLFLFGTWLPHREPPGGHRSRHRAVSAPLPLWLSLATCYHFGGFHEEHHEHPHLPWWKLPGARLSPAPLEPLCTPSPSS